MMRYEEFIEASIELGNRFGDICERVRKKTGIDVGYMPFRSLKKLDRIDIADRNKDIQAHVKELQGNKVGDPLRFFPFINEGTIKFDGSLFRNEGGAVKYGFDIFLHFKVLDADMSKSTFTVLINEYDRNRLKGRTDFMRSETVTFSPRGIEYGRCITEAEVAFIAYHEGLLTVKEREWYEKVFAGYDPSDGQERRRKTDQAVGILNAFAGTFLWLNRVINESFVSRSAPDSENSPKKSSKKEIKVTKDAKTGRKVIYLGGAVIKCSDNTLVKTRRNRIERQTMCWSVRGHYRRCKSGKIVYVRAHQKGPERTGDIRGRTYRPPKEA